MNKSTIDNLGKKLMICIFLIGVLICWSVDDVRAELIELPCYVKYSWEHNTAFDGTATDRVTSITAGKDEYIIQQLALSGAAPDNCKLYPLSNGIRGFASIETVEGEKYAVLEIKSRKQQAYLWLYRGNIQYVPSNSGKNLQLIFDRDVAGNANQMFAQECIDTYYYDSSKDKTYITFKDMTGDGRADAIFNTDAYAIPNLAFAYNEGNGLLVNRNVTASANPVATFHKRPLGINLYFDSYYITDIDIDTFIAAKAAAEAAATAAAEASATATAVAESAKVTNAPLITQFQVNGGALEKEGTGIVKAIFRAQNSPTDASWDKIQYRITRVNSTGTETELVDWTNFDVMLFSRGEADIQPIAGMNNLILYVKNTTSGAISKANTTLIAGTAAEREVALQSHYGGMYGIAKASKDAADSARTAVGDLILQNAWNFNIMGEVLGYIFNDILIEITQFQVNDGALEKEGTGNVRASFRVREDNGLDMSFTIKRVTTDGTEIELIPWTQLSSSNKVVDVPTIAGINNYILYIKDNDSNATSKATATVIAGTAAQREAALKSYYGGMYGELKDGTYGLSALKSLIDTVNGVAGQAKTAASNAKISADTAGSAVKSGSTTAIGVLTDTTKGLTQTYDKANVAATNASAAATNSSTAASIANTAASRALTTINNTQADDGGTTKSAAILAKEAKDNAGTAVTQLTSDTAGTIRADLTTTKTDASTAAAQAAAAADRTIFKGQLTEFGEVELTAAQWAYVAHDLSNQATNQLTSATAGTIRADLTTTKSDASTAKTQSTTAADRVWDATEGKSAATLAKEARDKVNEVSTVVNTMSQAITPIIHSVKGQNGATCTTGTTFIVVTSASNATQYRARLSGGSWTSWGSNNTITVSVGSTTGPKTIEVQARSSPTGTPASDSITIFKIVQ